MGSRRLVSIAILATSALVGCSSSDSSDPQSAPDPTKVDVTSPSDSSSKSNASTPSSTDLCPLLSLAAAQEFMGAEAAIDRKTVGVANVERCGITLTEASGRKKQVVITRSAASRTGYDNVVETRKDAEPLSGIGEAADFSFDMQRLNFYTDGYIYGVQYTQGGAPGEKSPTSSELKAFLTEQASYAAAAL